MLRFIIQCCYLVLFNVLVFSHAAKNDTILTSAYAKVAKWGATDDNSTKDGVELSQGRSSGSSGQTLFTQRSDAQIRAGQNLRPFYIAPTNKLGYNDNNNPVPGRGEVIQDRFNPPPYFDYMADGHKHNHHHHTPDGAKIVYSAAADSSNSQAVIKPAVGGSIYDSPLTSYNPPPAGVPLSNKPLDDDSKPPSSGQPAYPPITDNKPDIIYAAPQKPPPMKFPAYLYDIPQSETKPDDVKYPPYMMKPDSMLPGPYAPPSDDQQEGPPITPTVPPPNDDDNDDMYDYHHHHHHHHHDNDDDKQPDDDMMQPPPPEGGDDTSAPSDNDDFPKNIPEYLDHDPAGKYQYFNYDDYYHHHHHRPLIYHEVKHHHHHTTSTTTTTTEAPEDERVNKGHYSYYYLGRKLWYVPLYFSVYFMIYITILILKSIARHKVTFAHDLQDIKGRSLNDNNVMNNNAAAVDETTEQVTKSIQNFKARYYAM